ncbi:Aerobic C4-dicarboxylate transporter for fumarate, L-malate, D-malate, succunate, aspartate [Desulfosporosinus sp. I2]|uniref:dicarboxylate/amino acid:cation symporter n=1 Tax=Desulfosporosinus sp. I2 TaxID=1617025 RepID=UPI00061EB727|nr:dicarboxylate/amino acid:cation symporter [Desulfosporosinus sp. I2]KJR45312.1 Aerobic C4-dicarboxylate transporter for fumarate, L-malate, D-malate, succunate, aspartate [Desulfosporosinus sp. I2]
MMIAPIIFCTVVVGIASMGDMKKVGRVGLKALIYFEIVSTIALIIGLIVVNLYQPGAGINATAATLDAKSIATYTTAAKSMSTVDFFLKIIPNTVVDAFAKGEILQVLLVAILSGLSLSMLGEKGKPVINLLDIISKALFGIIGMIMKVAPIGAFGAMAFTIGKYGIHTLFSLGKLMAGVYTTSFLFIFIVLGLIAKLNGFSIWKFIKFIKEEIFIVVGTSSSESVLPRMMDKLERLGCSKSVVGLVIPTGYSFNLDGTTIYLSMAAIFIAQACNVPLTIMDQVTICAVLMLTSKGAAAVTGGGFITLAATLASISSIPVAGLALLLGVDRFMSEARALTNLIGNGVATVVVSNWEKEFDSKRAELILNGVNVEDLPVAAK